MNEFSYPVEYKMYVSYSDIIKAIEPWGTVEAILVSPGILWFNHLFIVRFKKPIAITGKRGNGICTDSYGSLEDTPFFMRGMHRDGLAMYNMILSPTKIAFDISCLSMGEESNNKRFFPSSEYDGFHSGAIMASTKLVPDERLREYINKSWSEERKKEIEGLFTQEEKIDKLLKWITASGQALLSKGISITSLMDRFQGPSIKEIPTDDIISNYRDNNWSQVYNHLN
jgi:hypothetical protein